MQAALGSISKGNTERKIVLIKSGTYGEHIRLENSFLTLLGEDRLKTRIVWKTRIVCEINQRRDDPNANADRKGGASFNLGLFVSQANANPAAQSLSRDLAIGATAVVIWIVQESRRIKMRGLVWVLLSCITVAFAFGAPLFLYLRERRLEELWIEEQNP